MSRIAVFISLFLSLVAWSAPNGAHADCTDASNHYVRSVGGLLEHEAIHSLNVQVLMVEAARKDPKRYAETFPYLLGYAGQHDVTKQKREFLLALCKLYGRNLQDFPSDSPERQTIGKMNSEEKAAKIQFFQKVGLLNAAGAPADERAQRVISLLEELERSADNVERVENPVSAEEMGKLEVKNGKPVSKMDAMDSFNRYVARDASPARKHQLGVQYQMLRDFYQTHHTLFAGYAGTLAAGEINKRSYYISRAKGWVADYSTFMSRVLNYNPRAETQHRSPLPDYLERDLASLAMTLKPAKKTRCVQEYLKTDIVQAGQAGPH